MGFMFAVVGYNTYGQVGYLICSGSRDVEETACSSGVAFDNDVGMHVEASRLHSRCSIEGNRCWMADTDGLWRLANGG